MILMTVFLMLPKLTGNKTSYPSFIQCSTS